MLCTPPCLDSEAPDTQAGATHSPSNFTLGTDKAMNAICYKAMGCPSSTPCHHRSIDYFFTLLDLGLPTSMGSIVMPTFPSSDLTGSGFPLSPLGSMLDTSIKPVIGWCPLGSHMSPFLSSLSFLSSPSFLSNNCCILYVALEMNCSEMAFGSPRRGQGREEKERERGSRNWKWLAMVLKGNTLDRKY